MKKKGVKKKINFSNRLLYTFITLGILAIIGVGVYAAYPASGAGHNSNEIDFSSGMVASSVGTIADANGGWLRTYGNTGWYSQSYGGGWYMSDGSWLRSYGSKDVYIDKGLRVDNGIASGPIGLPGAGNIQASGSITAGGAVTGGSLCIGGVCKTSWPTYTYSCPSGWTSVGGSCIAGQAAATWYVAITTCRSSSAIGSHLCSSVELQNQPSSIVSCGDDGSVNEIWTSDLKDAPGASVWTLITGSGNCCCHAWDDMHSSRRYYCCADKGLY